MFDVFDAIPAGSTARLRDFINQTDAVGVADFADKCLALFDHWPWLSFWCLVQSGLFLFLKLPYFFAIG